mgnify:CR=1 FL=1
MTQAQPNFLRVYTGTIYPISRKKHKAILLFKFLNGLAPQYLRNIFRNRATPYTLRDNQAKLNLPKPRTNYLKRAICYNGASSRYPLLFFTWAIQKEN